MLFFSDGQVQMKTYEATAAGLIQSFVDRFPSPDVDAIVQELWEKDRPYFWTRSPRHGDHRTILAPQHVQCVVGIDPTADHGHCVTEKQNGTEIGPVARRVCCVTEEQTQKCFVVKNQRSSVTRISFFQLVFSLGS